MTYRDERDALRGRIQGLEQDLDEARRSQQTAEEKRARIEQIEGRMREAEQDLQALRSELASLRGAPPPNKRARVLPFLIGGTFTLFALGGAFLAIVYKAPPPRPHERIAPPPAVVTAPAPPGEPPGTEAPPAPPPAPARQVAARWKGKVTRANGLPFGAGAACDVDSTLEGNGEKGSVVDLSVTCGGRPVYRSTDQLEGMSMNGYGLGEQPGKEAGTFTYAVRYSDTGTRSGPRTQISLDSTQGQGAVWSDVVPIFRVEFQLPTFSAPVRGERLLSPAPAKEP
ncbi:hypothetical protein [Polyangium jinanense]|uniref:Uncharacterized protein n=1 Tax=Polyangium jinanense TaxID=2829994 RepID=A0A9X3X8P1_9BACT|nr:hypothetical protein [Polyangium jinanense]MDC3984228.1 hypothetical protein [Polyangium jinanense]